MKPLILTADGLDKGQFEALSKVEQFDLYPERKVSQEKLLELIPRLQGLVIRSKTIVTKELVDQAPNLKYIIRAGEGTDNIDKKYCQEKGIKVSNTPGANNNSAGEHAVALMLSVLRHISSAHLSMKEGRWDKSLYTGLELYKKKVGIIGFGRIGQIVAKRISGFEPEIFFFDPMIGQDTQQAKKIHSLEELFKTCDILSVHVPLIDKTRNLIDKNLLSLMPSHSILINAARGGIVNEDDLYQVLKEKKIRGAGFDVFANEPLENSKLTELENIILTPHLGASTEEAQQRVGGMVVHQLKEFFINKNLLNEVRIK